MQNGQKIFRMPMGPQAAIIFGVLAISTGSIFARFAQNEAPSLVISAYRMTIATLFLLPFAVSRYRVHFRKMTKKEFCLILLSGVFLALHFASWITSLEYTTVASSVVLVTTVPLWVAIISALFLKERASLLLIIGLTVALAGGVIVGLGKTCALTGGELTCYGIRDFFMGEHFFGNLLALGGAWAASGYLLIGRKVRETMPLVPYAFMVYGVAAILLILAAVGFNQKMFGYSFETNIWFLGLAIFPQIIGHSIYNWALGYIPATYVAVVLLGEPLGASLLAVILLKEIPTFFELFGGLLILTGIYLASRSQEKSGKIIRD